MSVDLWPRGCERLAAELPEQQFNTWIRPLPAPDVADDGPEGAVVSLRVPNRFKLDWIRSQYAGRIEATLAAANISQDMLLQSWSDPAKEESGPIRIFPAVPFAWQDL